MALTYTSGVGRNHPSPRWPMRRFSVVEDSMRPTLNPGDGLLGLRLGRARRGQVRVFPDPTRPTRWLVKRVGEVRDAAFEAQSDNPHAPGVVDSRQFGWVPVAGSYRVVWTARRVD
jgi:phage repressor protein C with HTH and peptisase S24 domain